MKSSTLGILLEKLDRSGINGSPVITDAQLVELHRLLAELVEIAKDINDSPLRAWAFNELGRVDRIVEARQLGMT